MTDKRSAVRVRSFLRGRVVFNNGQSSMDCVVRDISSTGARLEFSEAVTIPDRFELYVPQKDTTYRVVLQWRRAGEIGVAIENGQGTGAPEASPDGSAARIQHLEAEVSQLRVLLALMRSELDVIKLAKAS